MFCLELCGQRRQKSSVIKNHPRYAADFSETKICPVVVTAAINTKPVSVNEKRKILQPILNDIAESCCNVSNETFEKNKEMLKKLSALLRTGQKVHDFVLIEPANPQPEQADLDQQSEIVDDILNFSMLSLSLDSDSSAYNIDAIKLPDQRKIAGHPKDYLDTCLKTKK